MVVWQHYLQNAKRTCGMFWQNANSVAWMKYRP
jgi:hypothetical protein